MLELSEKTETVLENVFLDDATRNHVRTTLIHKCGNNVPFCEDSSPEEMERIRFSVLKLSKGDINKFHEAVELANIDWRDLFMPAGFGHDTEAHMKWYENRITS